jgi:hypothetical protein
VSADTKKLLAFLATQPAQAVRGVTVTSAYRVIQDGLNLPSLGAVIDLVSAARQEDSIRSGSSLLYQGFALWPSTAESPWMQSAQPQDEDATRGADCPVLVQEPCDIKLMADLPNYRAPYNRSTPAPVLAAALIRILHGRPHTDHALVGLSYSHVAGLLGVSATTARNLVKAMAARHLIGDMEVVGGPRVIWLREPGDRLHHAAMAASTASDAPVPAVPAA